MKLNLQGSKVNIKKRLCCWPEIIVREGGISMLERDLTSIKNVVVVTGYFFNCHY